MRRDLFALPVAPAAHRGNRLRIGPKLTRPRHQPVGLAEGVRRDGIAPQVGFLRRHLEQQRAPPEQPPVVVPPGAREHDLGVRRLQNGLEVPPVGRGDRQGVEFRCRDDVVGQQPILDDAARPARRVEAEEADESPRRCRERARRHPADRNAGVDAIVLLQRLQVQVERCGRPGEQRLAPDPQRAPTQQPLPRLFGGFDAIGEQTDDIEQQRTAIACAGPVVGRQYVDQPRPCFHRRQRRVGGQYRRPPHRQFLERTGMRRQQRIQSSHSRLRQAPQQDVGERGRRLPVPARGDANPMHEVQFQVRVSPKRQEMIVVLRRNDRRDGDVGGPGEAGRDEYPGPAHRLHRFVIGGRRAYCGDSRCVRFRLDDVDRIAVEPGRYRPRPRDPAQLHPSGDPVQQRPPDRRELGDSDDLDRAEQRRCSIQPVEPGRHQVGRPFHRQGQRVQGGFLERGDRAQARVLASPRPEVDARAPRLAQRVSRGVHHAGQGLDPVQLAKLRVRQDRPDSLAQCIVVDRPGKSAGKPRRELLEGHDLQPVPAFAGGVQSELAHRQSAVRDRRPAPARFHPVHPILFPHRHHNGRRLLQPRDQPVAGEAIHRQPASLVYDRH